MKIVNARIPVYCKAVIPVLLAELKSQWCHYHCTKVPQFMQVWMADVKWYAQICSTDRSCHLAELKVNSYNNLIFVPTTLLKCLIRQGFNNRSEKVKSYIDVQ